MKILDTLLPILLRKGLVYKSDSIDTIIDIPTDDKIIKVKFTAQNVTIQIERDKND